jgi:riboflavin kinase
MLLRGLVTGGIGGLAHWMTLHADLYETKTGVRLYPGSLNVVLDHPWHVDGHRVRLEPPEYGVGLSIVPCTVRGIDAFILRTDKNDRGEGDHPPHVIEVAAAVRLRDALDLQDGDEVEVELMVADQVDD